MSEVQRYAIEAVDQCPQGSGQWSDELVPHPQGEAVKYDDHAAALKAKDNEIARLQGQTRWQCECGGTKVEIAQKDAEIAKLCERLGQRDCEHKHDIGELQAARRENDELREDAERLNGMIERLAERASTYQLAAQIGEAEIAKRNALLERLRSSWDRFLAVPPLTEDPGSLHARVSYNIEAMRELEAAMADIKALAAQEGE